MKILTCEQGSPEWLAARLGIPTASRFEAILTPGGKKSGGKGARTYRNELLAEWLLGQPLDWGTTEWTHRGTEMEAEARDFYALLMDAEVRQVGFMLRDDGMVGGSPDGLIGEDGGIEIKCYGAKHHVAVLMGEDIATTTQVQGNLWISEREWWDVLAYNPAMPHVRTRIYRNDLFIRDLAAAVDEFVGELLEARKHLVALGAEPREPFGGMLEAVA